MLTNLKTKGYIKDGSQVEARLKQNKNHINVMNVIPHLRLKIF